MQQAITAGRWPLVVAALTALRETGRCSVRIVDAEVLVENDCFAVVADRVETAAVIAARRPPEWLRAD